MGWITNMYAVQLATSLVRTNFHFTRLIDGCEMEGPMKVYHSGYMVIKKQYYLGLKARRRALTATVRDISLCYHALIDANTMVTNLRYTLCSRIDYACLRVLHLVTRHVPVLNWSSG
jgi:hypothetical protein